MAQVTYNTLNMDMVHIDALVQERRNAIANSLVFLALTRRYEFVSVLLLLGTIQLHPYT